MNILINTRVSKIKPHCELHVVHVLQYKHNSKPIKKHLVYIQFNFNTLLTNHLVLFRTSGSYCGSTLA